MGMFKIEMAQLPTALCTLGLEKNHGSPERKSGKTNAHD
jgi:hypothetical protein